ncbi:Myb-like DNA-binding domain protein, partial [Quaeritorhiza haematococci]
MFPSRLRFQCELLQISPSVYGQARLGPTLVPPTAFTSKALDASLPQSFTSKAAINSARKSTQKWKQVEEGIELYGLGKWAKVSTFVVTRSRDQCRFRWTLSVSPDIRKGSWTEVEDTLLRTGVALHDQGNWKVIASRISGRTALQCVKRWTEHLSPEIKKGNWTSSEDKLLNAEIQKLGAWNWQALAEVVPGRTGKQCYMRWTRLLDPDIKKGRWTAEEDRALAAAVQQYGEGNWTAIADTIQGRTDNQCGQRWNLCLSPNIEKEPWSQEEDSQLQKAVAKFGVGKWV